MNSRHFLEIALCIPLSRLLGGSLICARLELAYSFRISSFRMYSRVFTAVSLSCPPRFRTACKTTSGASWLLRGPSKQQSRNFGPICGMAYKHPSTRFPWSFPSLSGHIRTTNHEAPPLRRPLPDRPFRCSAHPRCKRSRSHSCCGYSTAHLDTVMRFYSVDSS